MDQSTHEQLHAAGEAIEGQRMQRRAEHPHLTLTGLYNVLGKLRAGEKLTPKEQKIHEDGQVSILRELHDELDATVSRAYGWPYDLTDEQILERLVALNHERAEEEKRGIIRWLRPEFQNPGATPSQQGLRGIDSGEPSAQASATPPLSVAAQPWPKKLSEQVSAIRDLVAPGTSWSAAATTAAFKSAKVEQVQEVMESLAALGILISIGDENEPTWTAPRISAGL